MTPPSANSQHALDVGLREIAADIEQGTVVLFRNLISKTVAEIQAGGMEAFSPAAIGRSNPPRRSRGYCDRVEAKSVDQEVAK